MQNEPHELAAQIMQHYGAEAQKDILIEECAELIQAVEKTRRIAEKPVFTEDMVWEMADVYIMLLQFETQMSGYWRAEYHNAIMQQLQRQIERIENEEG